MTDKTKYSIADKEIMLKMFTIVEGVSEEVTALKVNIGKNNVILNQHHSRSTQIEGVVETIKKTLTALISKIEAINTNMKNVDDDLKPIKAHVKKVNRFINIAEGVPLFFKFIFWGFVFVSSGYGCYDVIVKLLN